MNRAVQLSVVGYPLRLARRWTIASRTGPGGGPGTEEFPVLLVRLRDEDGVVGYGESAPSNRYGEDVGSVREFLGRVDAGRLSFEDVEGSLRYLRAVDGARPAAIAALDLALHDGAAKRAGRAVHHHLGLGFVAGRHVTSFSIGIDRPKVVHEKVKEASAYPVLKLKLGGEFDRESLEALRAAAPEKWVRADANEAWKSREVALRELEWLAADGRVEFVEQPMPSGMPREDWVWLKERSPLPLMADESYCDAGDLERARIGFHAVNVKLVKTGGISGGVAALRAARDAGLKTMLGCMIETSVLISAAAHLAGLTEYLDLDGNLLVTNDPFRGVSAPGGVLSIGEAAEGMGLGVEPRPEAGVVF